MLSESVMNSLRNHDSPHFLKKPKDRTGRVGAAKQNPPRSEDALRTSYVPVYAATTGVAKAKPTLRTIAARNPTYSTYSPRQESSFETFPYGRLDLVEEGFQAIPFVRGFEMGQFELLPRLLLEGFQVDVPF